MILDKVLYVSIILYVLFITLISFIKPSFLCDSNNKKFKSFGTKENETVCPIQILSVVSCVSIYLIVMIYMLIVSKLELH